MQNSCKYCKITVTLIIEGSMSVKTNNIYGKIVISDNTIERFVLKAASDSYGIVRFVPATLGDAIVSFFKFGADVKGVKVHCSGDRIYINLSVIVKYGVSVKAVIDALKESVKYKTEKFTGMIVDTINVKVMDVDR